MSATIRSQYLIGYLIICFQIGIVTLHIFPQFRFLLHDTYDIIPFLTIVLTKHLGPNMGVLMNRNVGLGSLGIQINNTIIGKTIYLIFIIL